MVYALALDGAGSAAVEALVIAGCQFFEQQAADEGLQASTVLGIGENLQAGTRTCDYCSMRGTCRYQEHYSYKSN